MMRTFFKYPILCLLLLAFALQSGCLLDSELQRNNPYDKDFNTELTCQDNGDCSRVGFCVSGKCAQCRTTNDCSGGLGCVAGQCQVCKAEKDCGGGLTCVSGKCQACQKSSECGSGHFCRENRCVACESEKPGTCILSGTYNNDLTLTSDVTWILRGNVLIGDDAKKVTLTIEPGTTILGEERPAGVLVIDRNSKINAIGTKDKPIIFTSAKPKGKRKRGDWGGIVINGRARINACAEGRNERCENFGEGGTGWYGGNDDNDSSGSLKYVRIEFAGRLISPKNELNGLSLQGVGSGTSIDYIQVHMAKDDGIEFFGGAASLRHVLITGAADDSLDWTNGWRGKGQFIVIQQYSDGGDNGIEADNNGENNKVTPRSSPTLSHLTIVGQPKSSASDLGIILREGTAAKIHNSIITGWNEACLTINGDETYRNAVDGQGKLSGELIVTHSIFNCTNNFANVTGATFTVSDFINKLNPGNILKDPMLGAPLDLVKPNFRPSSKSPARGGAKALNDAFFAKPSFIGGVDPNNDWTVGWTTTARN